MARLPGVLLDVHRRANRESAGAWASFAEHRRYTTGLLLDAAGTAPTRSLAVLGAGNGNDLDLERLCTRYQRVSLVDLDEAALARACGQVSGVTSERLSPIAPVDLSGALARLASWKRDRPGLDQLAALPAVAHRNVTAAVPGPFDVVASACLLSQIMWTCYTALGEAHPLLRPISMALAVAHLRTLLTLTRPGGTAILVSDTVSSDTYPVEELFARDGGQALLDEVARTDVAFLGTNPAFVRQVLAQDIVASPLVAEATGVPPWLWTLSPRQTLLVHALVIRRRP